MIYEIQYAQNVAISSHPHAGTDTWSGFSSLSSPKIPSHPHAGTDTPPIDDTKNTSESISSHPHAGTDTA